MQLLDNAGLVSNVFFAIATVTLFLPLIKEAREKKYWERLQEIKRRLKNDGQPVDQISIVMKMLAEDRLGGYLQHRKTLLLAGAFTFLGVVFLVFEVESKISGIQPV